MVVDARFWVGGRGGRVGLACLRRGKLNVWADDAWGGWWGRPLLWGKWKTWELDEVRTLTVVDCIHFLAECLCGHGFEVGLEHFRPTCSICGGFKVEIQSLKTFAIIDAVGEVVFRARLALADEIHVTKMMQVGCEKVSVCQSHTPAARPRTLTISSFPVLAQLLDILSLDKS